MYKSFVLGICFVIISVILATIFNATNSLYLITGVFGGITWFLAGTVGGMMGSGDKARLINNYESEEEHNRRSRWSGTLFFVGLPNMIAAVIFYFKLG